MTSDEAPLDLDGLAELAQAATPGPWVRQTVGHASVYDIAATIAAQLHVPLPDGIPASTDATWVWDTNETKTVAFIGNGPRQTENGDLIAALDPSTVLRLIEAARLGEAWREAEAANGDAATRLYVRALASGYEAGLALPEFRHGSFVRSDHASPAAALQALAATLQEQT